MQDGSTMVIEAAKGGHTSVVKLLLEYPNRVLMHGQEVAQISTADQLLVEVIMDKNQYFCIAINFNSFFSLQYLLLPQMFLDLTLCNWLNDHSVLL